MKIRCHGSRGSIPVSGAEYNRYGGNTTCLEIRSRSGQVVVVDAGTGIRPLGLNLRQEKRADINLLFTHSHWDHILGFPFFQPLYDPAVTVRIAGCPSAQGNLRTLLSKTMSQPYFPVPFDALEAKVLYSDECPLSFRIDSLLVKTIPLSHPNLGMGFRFEEDGRSFVFLTDNELGYKHRGGRSPADYIAFSEGADLLFHDAHYTTEEYRSTRTWGHSTFTEALDLALEAGVKRLGLFHHDPGRTDDAVDRIVGECREKIDRADGTLECFAVGQDTAIDL